MTQKFETGDTVQIRYDDGTLVKVVLGEEHRLGMFEVPYLDHLVRVDRDRLIKYTVTLLEKNLPPTGTPIRGRTNSGNPFLGFVVNGSVTGVIFFEGSGPETTENIRSINIASWEIVK